MTDPMTGMQQAPTGPAGAPASPPPSSGVPRRSPYRRTWPRALVVLLVGVLFAVIGLSGYLVYRAWRASEHWKAAEAAIGQRHYPQAIGHLQAYLAVWPDSAPAHFLLARTAWRMGNYDLAKDHLDRCQQLGWNAEVLKQERYLLRAHQGDITPETEKYLVPLARKDRNNPEAPLIFEALAKGYLRTHRMIPARHCLDAWIDQQPNNSEALVWRAWLRGVRGDREGSLEDYRRAVELDPSDDQARLRLCELLLAQVDPDQAVPHLEVLRAHRPDQPAVLLAWDAYYRSQGRTSDSTQTLDRLLADPRFKELLRYRLKGELRWPTALSPETQDWVRQDGELAPPEGRTWNHLAQLYVTALDQRALLSLTHNELAPVEPWLRQALRVAPHDSQAHFLMAQYLDKKGRHAEADKHRTTWQALKEKQKELDKVGQELARTPDDSALRCRAAELLLQLGQEADGLRWLDRIAQDDPQYVPPATTVKELQTYYERSKDPLALGLLGAFHASP